MASDPLFGFKPVAAAHDPLMGFTPTPAAASSDIAQPGDDSLGNMAWNDPRAANASTKDFLLAHLASAGSGLSQIGGAAADYARTAANVYGQGDSTLASLKALAGDITGPSNPNSIANLVAKQTTGQNNANDYLSNLARAKADTAAASDRLGTAGTIAANMTGGGPLGELASGAGAAITPLVGGSKWLGGVLGSAAVGGGSTAAGELGRNEALSPWDIGVGTAFGAAGGAPGGVVGRGGTVAPPISADDLHAAATKVYAPLSKILFDGKEVHPELAAADQLIANIDLTGQQSKLAKSTMAEVANLKARPQFTAEDIQKAQGRLDDIASNPNATDQDKWMAPRYSDALENVMQNRLPFAGVPASAPQASGYAATVRDAGDLLHGRAEDVDRLNTMVDKSNIGGPGQGDDIGAQMGAWLKSNKGQQFNPPGTPQFDAANALAGTAQKPLTSGQGLTMWDLKHHLMWPAIGLGGAGALSLTGTEEGHQPAWAQIPEDIAGLGAGFLLKNRLGAAGKVAQQQMLDAYRTTASTGKFQAPVLPDAAFREAVRRLIFGQGAAGQLPGQ
jgi:hypothetical protein